MARPRPRIALWTSAGGAKLHCSGSRDVANPLLRLPSRARLCLPRETPCDHRAVGTGWSVR
eukprot:9370995-Pyramimonas_sp.AAC.1